MPETLKQEYERLMNELAEMNSSLNERQKEELTSDFYGDKSRIEQKIKRIIEIEKQLKESKIKESV